jgi:hypothetical protein
VLDALDADPEPVTRTERCSPRSRGSYPLPSAAT